MVKIIVMSVILFVFMPEYVIAADNEKSSDLGDMISGKVGVNFWESDAENKDLVDDGNLGFAFADIAFVSRDFFNVRLGSEVLAVGELWADGAYDNAFANDELFQKDIFLKSIYLTYAIPGFETEILLGRAEFETAETMDGDSYQGIQVKTQDIPKTSLYVSIINRWVEDASTDYTLDGIQKKWLNGGDVGDGVANTIYSIIADIDLVEDMLSITPYYNFQSGALTTYGMQIEMELEFGENVNGSVGGIYAVYEEDTDDPMDEDAYSFLIHTELEYGNFLVGIGYYEMSNDARVDLTAVGNDVFDPLEEGVYGGDPDDNTVYLGIKYSREVFEAEIMIGETDVDATDEGCSEIDIYFTYFMNEDIALEMMFVDVDDDNSDLDYQIYAGGVSISF